jgi:kumamolisin
MANNRKVFANSVTPLPEELGITPHGLILNAAQPDNRTEQMTLLFSIAPADNLRKELEQMVAQGQTVSPKELNTKYASPAEDVQRLSGWLKDQGFEIVRVSPDNSGVYARASVAQIEKTLGVTMVRVTKDGITYTAARNAPSLPDNVSQNVHAIIGLQPFRHAHKHSRMLPMSRVASYGGVAVRRGAARSAATRTARPHGPAKSASNAPPYHVAQILKAYNADTLKATGSGQTIAILIDTVPSNADLRAFWKANKVKNSTTKITKINVNSAPLPAPSGEETLDVEWSSGIAPGAKIRVYATGTLEFVSLDAALDRIIADLSSQPGMRQVSISLGLGETFMAKDEVDTQNLKFLKLAAAGVNVFVSSGDAGSNPDVTGHSSSGPTQAEYESSDPNVVGVGGTSLTLAPNGSVSHEAGWTGSGGGKSVLFDRPAWQKGLGIPTGTQRLVPDVSLAADPNTGALLVLNGSSGPVGGTSWSAPVWAAFCALLNETRAKAGKPPLGFLNPLIYPLLGTSSFRDIVNGNNGAFNAGPGYDMVTGIGVPNLAALAKALS